MTNNNHTILVICGPTASGKTSLALSVAKHLSRANILSADSRQIYKDLGIVTGKDIPKNLSRSIKLFGLDLVNPDADFNVASFTEYAQQIIQSSLAENIPLIIVGGTGLYLQSITSSLLTAHVPPNQVLRDELEKLTLPALKTKLMEINSAKFISLNNSDANNPRRLIRAIEISSSLNHSRGSVIPAKAGIHQVIHPTFHWIGLTQDKDKQKEGILQRVKDRLKIGAIREVQKLREKYPNSSLPIFSSLGVEQIIDYQNQKISLEELIDLWTTAENNYAKRQMVWFKKQSGIIWYDKSNLGDNLVTELAELLK